MPSHAGRVYFRLANEFTQPLWNQPESYRMHDCSSDLQWGVLDNNLQHFRNSARNLQHGCIQYNPDIQRRSLQLFRSDANGSCNLKLYHRRGNGADYLAQYMRKFDRGICVCLASKPYKPSSNQPCRKCLHCDFCCV